jgi:hypothetical protein
MNCSNKFRFDTSLRAVLKVITYYQNNLCERYWINGIIFEDKVNYHVNCCHINQKHDRYADVRYEVNLEIVISKAMWNVHTSTSKKRSSSSLIIEQGLRPKIKELAYSEILLRNILKTVMNLRVP